MHSRFLIVIAATVAIVFAAGCGGEDKPAQQVKQKKTAQATEPADDQATEVASEAPAPPRKKFQPVQLGGDSEAGAGGGTTVKAKLSGEKRSQAIIVALQPLQVLLGEWRWITRKDFGGSKKSGEDLKWVWDFKTDSAQPSLTAKSEGNPYFEQVWISFLPEDEKYQAKFQGREGDARIFHGTWTGGGEPKEESDGKKLQHTHKLQLTQASPTEGDQWQLVFNQLDNNQYLMDLLRRPPTGKQFGPLDVVRQQRLGTSFAVADSDNPGPKCIISGGLGTMNVTYKGKSYPVCCSGCAAAFNDDPEKWLAKLAEREKLKKKDAE
jgi:hypothetical protein